MIQDSIEMFNDIGMEIWDQVTSLEGWYVLGIWGQWAFDARSKVVIEISCPLSDTILGWAADTI